MPATNTLNHINCNVYRVDLIGSKNLLLQRASILQKYVFLHSENARSIGVEDKGTDSHFLAQMAALRILVFNLPSKGSTIDER